MKAWIFIMAPVVYKMPRIMDTSAVAKVAPLRKPIQKVYTINCRCRKHRLDLNRLNFFICIKLFSHFFSD